MQYPLGVYGHVRTGLVTVIVCVKCAIKTVNMTIQHLRSSVDGSISLFKPRFFVFQGFISLQLKVRTLEHHL